MKYLKTFESVSGSGIRRPEVQKYWKIPNKEPKLSIALKKLQIKYGCDITKFDLYKHYLRKEDVPKFNPRKNLYVICEKVKTPLTDIDYWSFSDKNSNVKNMIYMGEIEVTPEEVEQYELEQISNKYNI